MLLVHAAWGREPGTNTKNPVIKRVALTMLYLVKGGTMDQAATALGISRPRSVAYINKTQDVLSAMAKSMIFMPPAEELAAVEDGFYATAGFPDTIGAETSSIGPQGKTCEETRVQFADWQVWWHRMETACDQSDEASGSLHLDSSRHTEHVLHLNKGLNALLEGHKSTVATVSDLMLVLCHTNNRAALREHTDLSPLRRAGAPCSTCSLGTCPCTDASRPFLRIYGSSITSQSSYKGISLADVRALLDSIVQRYPSLKPQLNASANVVHSPVFEAAVVKVIKGGSRLSTGERDAIKAFEKAPVTDTKRKSLPSDEQKQEEE
ncbi:hypothetical protein F441_20356 [Phytophthora nicotianae CJ01A1]|uniref:Uncharacterized protein n=1 Tax=Phytophthora nicotianae CJ01A1 TaxID=1317063 RepID=W2VZ23_PHYNI|nr:hypothetical protein F441_20356 [Phytophthora nicotianae CJ01A1]